MTMKIGDGVRISLEQVVNGALEKSKPSNLDMFN